MLGRSEIGRWPGYVSLLEKQNLIRKTDNNEYVLARNLDSLDFWTLYKSLPYPLPRQDDLNHVQNDDVWMQHIGALLIESDKYLTEKLSIPLSELFDERTVSKTDSNPTLAD